ncbi:hypothetical protein ACROYT_G006312 [Oculina patagonica]
MSSFFKQLFPFMKVKKKKEFSYIIRGVDPYTIWNLVGELGDGSFGKVYKAERKTDGILAAAKIIDVKDESELDDFMVEIDILSECKHKHVVGMYEAYYHDNKLWMMLEFCSGGALDDLILELERGLTEEQIKIVCKQMFECLHFLHTHKVIHRDLKAGNLLLTNDGNIKLADFGVSAKNKKTIQRRTTFIGTPYWMAPEVIVTETCKDDPYDYKADIWSAGITLIELAEMQPPYHDMHPMRVLFKIPKADPPLLQFKNRWSKDFHDFLSLCVVKSAEMRSSAADLLTHPFIADVVDHKPLKELYNEAKAVVIEEFEDLPEDKEKKGKEGLKAAESTESLDESEELSSETGSKDFDKEGEGREKELEESTENEKEVETKEQDEEIKELVDEKKEEMEEKKEEVEEKAADAEEKKEDEKQAEEIVKEGEPEEKKGDSEEAKEDEVQQKKEHVEDEKESVEEEKGEAEKKKEVAEEEKDEVEEKKEEAQERIEKAEEKEEEAEEKKEEVEEKKEEVEEVEEKKDEAEEKREETEKPKEEAESEKEVPEDTPKDAEENKEDAKEQVEEVEDEKDGEGEGEETAKKEPQPGEGVPEVVVTENDVPAAEQEKETQEVRDKYSARLDNILDSLEEDEQAQPTGGGEEASVTQENEKTEDGEKQEEQEETTTVQEKEEEKKEEEKSGETEELAKEKETEDTEDKIKENKEVNEDENKTEDKEDEVFDDKEKAAIPNGDVLIEPISKKKKPSSSNEEKSEATDGSEEKNFKTLKRIRKYEKDGKIVTETTSRVVDVSQEDYRNALMKEQQQRKVNLREMKVLQREEQKQGMLLMAKIRRQWEAQEQRFEQELQDLEKKYELDLDTSSRNQKKEIEKLELAQNADLRTSSRKMKQDQEKELRRFRDSLKEEQKSSKKEVDQLPRNQRKESWRKKKEEMEVSQRQAEHEFLAMQRVEFEKFCKELIELHRERMYNLEMQFLQAKHGLKRGHEAELWEIEQRQLHERHQLARTQLKETFFLQRSQMLNRHQKECEQHTRLTKLKEEEMKRRHEIEKKRLPKIQRDEIKSKTQQYRKSLRIEKRVSVDMERELMKEFELIERKRARTEYEKMLFRQEMEAEELRISSESALKELQQLQNEKRHMLMESETTKLKERDEKHQAQLETWKADLVPRKKTLEEEFAREDREQQLFYSRNSTDYPISPETTIKEAEEEPGEIQVDGVKTPEDNSSSKSSNSGSMEV